MNDKAWIAGMGDLALAFPGGFTPEQQAARGELYRRKLDDLTDAEWLKAADRCVDEHKGYFPAVALLRELAKPPAVSEAQAVTVFDQVIDAGEYNPHGTQWRVRTIREKFGPAVAEAFTAAGGQGAFAGLSERNLPFVRKAFVEAYVAAVRAAPVRALPEAKKPELPA